MLPRIVLYKTLDRSVLIEGPGVATWDFDSYASAKLVCTALAISKSTTVAAQAEYANSGADLLVHFTDADYTNAVVGLYGYQIIAVTAGGLDLDVGEIGILDIRDKA